MVCHIRALVVLPTKELAQQVCQLYIQKSVSLALLPCMYMLLSSSLPIYHSRVFAVAEATILGQ